MDTILQELKSLPGVIGCYVSLNDSGTVHSNLPDFFTEEMASEAAGNLRRMLQMAEIKGLEPQSVSVTYDKYILFTMPIEETALLIALCEPNGNIALAATTACMLAPDLSKLIQQVINPSDSANETSDAKEGAASNETANSIDTEKTTAALAHVKTSLFQTIGPIADIIYDDCVEKWTRNNPADISRIFELIGHLSEEIDNPELFDEFKEKIVTLL